MHILYIVNKTIPSNDYRIQYQSKSDVCTITYGLPGRPMGVDAGNFVQMGFGESIKLNDFFHYLKLFIHLRRNRKRYDFVHLYSTSLILFGPIISWLAGIPSLITLTGFGRTFSSQKFKYRVLRPIYFFFLSITVRLSKRVIFQNHTDHEEIAKRFSSVDWKFVYVGSAVDAPIISKKDFNTHTLRILLVSRLLPDKGIHDFLEMAKRLHQESCKFVLIGPASVGFHSLLYSVKDYADQGIIHYMGELDTATTQEQYRQAHVLFFPSYGEGMSRVMLEVGFAKVCPIVYDISANHDLIKNGRGFMVNVGDVDEVERILRVLIIERDLLEENARAYQDHIINNFNIEAYSHRLDQILLGIQQ